MISSDWLMTAAPEFGVRAPISLPRVYFIGDAIGSIPPATGDGLGMALTTGIMAANYAMLGNAEAYRAAWKRRYRSRILRGKILHAVMIRKPWNALALNFCISLPSIPRWIYQLTREF